VSELSDAYVKDPRAVVKVNQRVTVHVLDVDLERKRISLSMKGQGSRREKKEVKRTEPVKREKRPEKPKPQPFNNPFAKAFRN